MRVKNNKIFELHAAFCKTLANPKRLIIITALEKKEMTVGELAKLLETSLSTTSQHLKILRDRDIVDVKKDGKKSYYFLNDKELVYATNRIREIILKLYRKKGEVIDYDFTSREHIVD